MILGERSRKNMEGLHIDLIQLIQAVAQNEKVEFLIYDGVRTIEEQKENVRRGASQTMDSRHLPGADGYGKAIDFAPLVGGKVTWKTPMFIPVIEAFKRQAKILNIPIVSGGDWKSFKDYCHIELDRKKYP